MASNYNDFSFSEKGMTFTLKNFGREYKRWTEHQKRKAIYAAREVMRRWQAQVVVLAQKMTPEYSNFDFNYPGNEASGAGTERGKNANALAESIVSNPTKALGGRWVQSGKVSGEVGVKTSWKSYGDEDFGGNAGWGVSSPQLALFLHEYWGSVAGPNGRARAAVKGAREGVVVGERFLARASEDTIKAVAGMASAVFKTNMQSDL